MLKFSMPSCSLACHLLIPFCTSFYTLSAQTVNCDTVLVVAQATAEPLTCDFPVGRLSGVVHPAAIKFHWANAAGTFSSNQRVISRPEPGLYFLTVTGPYGCTASISVDLPDDCLDYPLFPPPCPNVFEPPAEDCDQVCVREYLPGNWIFNNYNAAYSTLPFWPCGTLENDQWFALVAPSTSGSITAQAQNCLNHDGIQMGLYADCNAQPIVCNGGVQQGEQFEVTISTNDLIPGKVYFLQIDGWAGDQCEYFFPADSLSGTPAPPGNPNLTGLNHVCPYATVEFTLDDPPFATAYLWTGPPGTLFNGMPSPALFYVPDGKTVDITFGSDSGFVCVRAINYFKKPSPPICLDIHLDLIPATQLPDVTLCAEEIPYDLPWGDFALNSGDYEYNYITAAGCDSLVRQHVTVSNPIINSLGAIYRCAGTCFEIGGTQYCDPGTYTHLLTSTTGCDSTVSFSLIFNSAFAQINGGGELNCSNTQIMLSAVPNSNQFRWENLNGELLGTSPQLNVSNPGTYILEASVLSGDSTCTSWDTVFIGQNIVPPLLQVGTPQKLSCNTSEVNLPVTTIDSLTSINWSGPNGFYATNLSPTVQQAGIYTVTVSGLNDCTVSATVAVETDSIAPIFTLSADTISCDQNIAFLHVQTNLPNGQFQWNGPDSFVSNQAEPEITEPGMYTLTLTNPANGCSAQDSVRVLADLILPGIDVLQQAPECGDSLLIVNASSIISDVQFSWVGPNNFTAQGPQIEVAVDGWYIVKASTNSGCHSQISILVVPAPQAPEVTLSGENLINCTTTSALVQAASDISGCTFNWAGPGGFASNEPNPTLPLPGNYQLTVTTPNNCTAVSTYQVDADTVAPVVTATGGVLTCENPELTLFASSIPPNAIFSWIGPSTMTNENPIIVATPGIYLLSATLPNGCTATANLAVIDSCLVQTIDLTNGRSGIVVYPNASTGLLFVQSLDQTPILEWRIFSFDGRLLLQGQPPKQDNLLRLDLHNLPQGIYQLLAQIGKHWYSEAIILIE